jgi:quinol monooxygenase YgiN
MDEEPGTLDYEYYLSADRTVCHIHERYRDSEGLITNDDASKVIDSSPVI